MTYKFLSFDVPTNNPCQSRIVALQTDRDTLTANCLAQYSIPLLPNRDFVSLNTQYYNLLLEELAIRNDLVSWLLTYNSDNHLEGQTPASVNNDCITTIEGWLFNGHVLMGGNLTPQTDWKVYV